MSLEGALSIASGGLANINRQLALVSQNVANAGTPNYAAEISGQHSLTADGQGLGVISDPATRIIDKGLQDQIIQQNATVAGLQTTQTALQAIDAVQGTPGQGSDLASLLGKVQDQFSTLLTDPSNQTQQSAVVSAAANLAQGINTLSSAYTGQRQAAQNDIGDAVDTLNATLATIGTLSNRIVAQRAGGQSTADLENQRDAAVQTLSQLVSIKTLEQPNGDLMVVTTAGLALPTHAQSGQIRIADATMQPQASYPGGGVPGITLNGVDVTAQFQDGRIGADLGLRDSTLPTWQGELDEFAQTLASRFAAQGLTLFSDPTGAVPSSAGVPVQTGYVGFAGTIQVNPAVSATPSLVRDGTTAIVGSPTGASAFTPNPAGGPAGFTGMISRVLDYALGAQAQNGVPQPSANTAGLGPAGNLAAPYAAAPTLAGLASTMVASQAQQSASVTNQAGTEQA